MDRVKALVVAAAFAVVAAAVASLLSSAVEPRPGGGQSLMATTGSSVQEATDEPLRLSALDGEAPTAAYGATGDPALYIVVKLDAEHIAQAALHGFDLPPTTPHPHEDAVLVAYSATSTYLGCTVDLLPTIPPPGVWLMDRCHQGQYNVLDDGAPRPGTNTRGPLPSVDVVVGAEADPVLRVR